MLIIFSEEEGKNKEKTLEGVGEKNLENSRERGRRHRTGSPDFVTITQQITEQFICVRHSSRFYKNISE